MKTDIKKCVFSGTFDPPTTGHQSVIDGCLKIFDEVIVAVMVNPEKQPFLTVDERIKLLKLMYGDRQNVKVISFDGAAVDLLERENTPFYVRGIRNGVDLDFENANHYASKKLKKDLVTIYIPAKQEEIEVSSTLVKSCLKFNKSYARYIPQCIQKELIKILEKKDV